MTGSVFPDPDSVLRPPPESIEQRALDEKWPAEPLRVSPPWRIAGWLCQMLFSLGGG